MARLFRNPDGQLAHHAWPGGYPLYYLTRDGMTVCPKCANEETSDPPVACDVNWEEPQMYCDDCSERIESAYAEDEAQGEQDAEQGS